MSAIRQFVLDERGATAIEYALIAALIFLVIFTSVSNLGIRVSASFNNVANKM